MVLKQLYIIMQKIIIHNFNSYFRQSLLRLPRVQCPISLKRDLDIGKILVTSSLIKQSKWEIYRKKSTSFNIIIIISDSFQSEPKVLYKEALAHGQNLTYFA